MNIDEKINNIENTLNYYTPYPFIIPGLLKVTLGVIQAISALAISLFLSLPAICGHKKSEKIFIRSCIHISHGIANIFAGSIEAIPVLGTIFFGLRILNTDKKPAPGLYSTSSLSTCIYHPDFKFYGYKDVPIHEFLKMQHDEYKALHSWGRKITEKLIFS